MQWTVQIIVVLLNIVWIVFFLTPDPFSVFEQRRSTDEEMLFGDFCIQLPSVNIQSNESNDTNTTSEVSKESSLILHDNHSVNKSQQDCQCNKTNIQQKDLYSSRLSRIDLRPPAPGCEPKIIMTFPNMEVCIDVETFSVIAPLVPDWNETSASGPLSFLGQTTPASPSVLELTSSEVTTTSGLISASSSKAAPVKVTHRSKAPVKEKINQDPNRAVHASPPASPNAKGRDDCCFKFYPRRINRKLIQSYYMTDHGCPKSGVIFVTKKSRHICADPSLSWVEDIMRSLDQASL